VDAGFNASRTVLFGHEQAGSLQAGRGVPQPRGTVLADFSVREDCRVARAVVDCDNVSS